MASSQVLKSSSDSSRRAVICRTAARIFRDRGFDATAVSDIARALRMTKAGLYHYFPSKEAMLFEIMLFGMERMEDEVMRPARAVADPEARLRQMLMQHARIITRAEGAVAQLFHEQRALPASMRRVVNDQERRYFHLVRDTLRELKSTGRLRDVEPSIAALSLIGMIQWLPRWFRHDGGLTVDQAAHEITDLAMAAVIDSSRRRKNRRTQP
ncbi:MAG TPA: TetR/AcrR family transcriptional regulator [Vicinamibacterales bacterium]|nr:TetR/AcrR family transcriptional regulator [Vicinamibacterales bacterium]